MLLRYTSGLEEDAQQIETAIRHVLDAGYRTADLQRNGKPPVSTQEMGTRVLEALDNVVEQQHSYHAV